MKKQTIHLNRKKLSNTIWLIVIGVLAIFPVYLFLFKIGKCLIVNPSVSGQIGDTIGGIAGPIINLIAAILVFISFKEQIKANNLFAQEVRSNRLWSLYEELKKDITEFKSASNTGYSAFKMLRVQTQSKHQYISKWQNSPEEIKNFVSILRTIILTVNEISNFRKIESMTVKSEDRLLVIFKLSIIIEPLITDINDIVTNIINYGDKEYPSDLHELRNEIITLVSD